MKHLVILTLTALTFAACNSGNESSAKNGEANHEQMAMDSGSAASTEGVNAPVVKASFANVNVDVTTHLNEVLSHYFHVHYALTNDDAAEAKNGSTMLLQVISQFDNAAMPANHKEAYAKYISAIKEHADAIVKSAGVKEQRMHFSELSASAYELVKAFGAGKKIYYDHCPMALDNKGANWLSESPAIQNPYFPGGEMNACAKVQQVIE